MIDCQHLLFLFLFICLTSNFVLLKNDDSSDDKQSDDKKELKKKKGENEKSNSTDNDFDITQGFPILYPETHMMSLKRNISAIDSNITASESVEQDSVEKDEMNKCSKSVDLLFLLDSSESVKFSNWKIIIQFVKDICNRFRLRYSKVAIIRYASYAEIALPLTQFNDTLSRNQTIDDIFYQTGGTRTDLALQKADDVFQFEEQRSQVVILVTDGPTNRLEINKNHFVEGKDLVAGPAARLKEQGVVLFCIGVEPDSLTPEEIETMKDEMRLIASEPTKHHLFISDGYHELQRKVDAISRAACVVNGAWSAWSEFSPCSITCGFGTKVRMRTCSNPSPENNGAECNGQRVEIDECKLEPCTFQNLHGKPVVFGTGYPAHISPTMITYLTNVKDSMKKNTDVPYLANMSILHISKNDSVDFTGKLNGTTFECHTLEEVKLNDTQYSSSSVYSHDTNDEYVKKEYAPPNGKLNNQINGGGWCAEHKFAVAGDKNQYLQLDLGSSHLIFAVATQGSHLLDNWVTSYMLRYSEDGNSWKYYSTNPLTGNNDQNNVHHNLLTPPLNARYFQINPLEWNEKNGTKQHDICLRAALFQCKDTFKPEKTQTQNGTRREFIEHGVVLREQEVTTSHFPHFSSAKISLTSYVRKKRLFSLKDHQHQIGKKRILKRLRKTANCIIKRLYKKKCT